MLMDVWGLTAGRATYLPTELRRHELQRTDGTRVFGNDEVQASRKLIVAVSRLALSARD